VTHDRGRGVALYALAAVLLVVGGVWFIRAAPMIDEEPGITAGRATVERLVPDLASQAGAETLVLAPSRRAERNTAVRTGSYALVLVCAGEGRVRIRLSTTTVDSGRAVLCAPEPSPVELTVALASMLFLSVSSETDEEIVFRWRLVPSL
jgi:hypothetical protein